MRQYQLGVLCRSVAVPYWGPNKQETYTPRRHEQCQTLFVSPLGFTNMKQPSVVMNALSSESY